MCSFLWTFCWILFDYGSIFSAFEWHWEFCFQNAIDESLLFPGPKLVACMPCFQRSKDDAEVWCVSLCLNIGATASNLLLEKSHDHLMVSTISSGLIKKKKKKKSLYDLVQYYSSFQVCWELWTHIVPMQNLIFDIAAKKNLMQRVFL